jgi:hypothetical protein
MVIEGEVIPRLMQAHSDHEDSQRFLEALHGPGGLQTVIPTGLGVAFLDLTLSGSLKAMGDLLDGVAEGGAAAASLFDDLLAPTARRLVELWHDDSASYADITIGLGRLKQLARGLHEATVYNGDSDPCATSVLIAPRPGEEQTFGLYLMGELFRWSGWRTTAEASASREDIRECVFGDWYDVLCLNVDREERLEDLYTTLEIARGASRNKDLCILVSGQLFEEHPDLIDSVGADAAVTDAQEALRFMSETTGRRAAA